jgi:hypothetical protein
MPKYQMYFDTLRGEVRHVVEIDDTETLDAVLNEILYELRERGDVMKGDGEPQVTANGQALEFSEPLRHQGVRPNEVLRVSLIAYNG